MRVRVRVPGGARPECGLSGAAPAGSRPPKLARPRGPRFVELPQVCPDPADRGAVARGVGVSADGPRVGGAAQEARRQMRARRRG